MATSTGLTLFLMWIFLPTKQCTSEFELVILHTNDVHARVEQSTQYGASCSPSQASSGECYGGVARRKTAIDRERRNYDNVLLLDAGDQFQGTEWFGRYEGAEAAHFMNLLGYDAMALGSMEFTEGVSGLAQFLQFTNFSIVSSNLAARDESRLRGLYSRSVVIRVQGETIGIVGYSNPLTPQLVPQDGISNIAFEDVIISIQREVDALLSHAEGPVRKIICLGHAGINIDQEIATRVQGIDVVVGGFSNTFLYSGQSPSTEEPYGPYPLVVRQATGREVLVVHSYAYGKYLGKLRLVFDDDGMVKEWSGNPILLDSSIPEDADVAEEVRSLSGAVEEYRTEVVGTSLVLLNVTDSACRSGECNMGNFLTDELVHTFLHTRADPSEWTSSAIALWNGGALRRSLDEGPVSREDLLEVAPFRNEVVRLVLNGSALLLVLEHSVDVGERPSGAFLQMSGLRVVYDMSRGRGQRVVSVLALCTQCSVPGYQLLEPAANYSILTSSYLMAGGDGYSMLKEHMTGVEPLGYSDFQVMAKGFEDYSPIVAQVDGRITFAGEGVGSVFRAFHTVCSRMKPLGCPTCPRWRPPSSNQCPTSGAKRWSPPSGLLLLVVLVMFCYENRN